MNKKKRGRPPKSKNVAKIKTQSKSDPEPEYSWDTESIILMARLTYAIRVAIEENAIKAAVNKQCIPPDIVEGAIVDIGLGDWLERIPKD